MCIDLSLPKYYRCDKCGQYITKVETPNQMGGMCTGDASYRISGICGGSFSIEMTEEEYNAQLKEWENKRNEKNV